MMYPQTALRIQAAYDSGIPLNTLIKESGHNVWEYYDAIRTITKRGTDTVLSKNLDLVERAEKKLFQLADILNTDGIDPIKQKKYQDQFNGLRDFFAKANVNSGSSVVIPLELLK